MTSITVTGMPASVPTPRGALWAARGAAAVWRALTRRAVGRSTEQLPAALAAAAVRAMARQHAATDPGFAADLLAAADRHEAGLAAR